MTSSMLDGKIALSTLQAEDMYYDHHVLPLDNPEPTPSDFEMRQLATRKVLEHVLASCEKAGVGDIQLVEINLPIHVTRRRSFAIARANVYVEWKLFRNIMRPIRHTGRGMWLYNVWSDGDMKMQFSGGASCFQSDKSFDVGRMMLVHAERIPMIHEKELKKKDRTKSTLHWVHMFWGTKDVRKSWRGLYPNTQLLYRKGRSYVEAEADES